MNDTAHTPTPWKHVYSPGLNGISIYRDIDTGLAKGEWDGAQHIAEVFGQSHEEDKANAAFIVRAVNSHAALVAALERTLNQLDSLARATCETQTGLIDPSKSPAYAESRAALAAAKGQP